MFVADNEITNYRFVWRFDDDAASADAAGATVT